MIQKLKIMLATVAILAGAVGLVSPAIASAADGSGITAASCAGGTTTDKNGNVICVALGNDCKSSKGCLKDSALSRDLNNIVDTLSAGVGIVVVGTIIVGGIQYTVAGDNSGKVEEAKKRIQNGIIALIIFFLSFAFLQWLIPGGIFG